MNFYIIKSIAFFNRTKIVAVKIKLFNAVAVVFFVMLLQQAVIAQVATPCTLIQHDLFKLPRKTLTGEGPVVFKMAISNNNFIAFSSCNKKIIYFINSNGEITDSVPTPFTSCLRNMEFDEWNNLLLIENTEQFVYRISMPTKQVEKLAYNKPEDWFYYQNHFYQYYELSSIPAYYYNPNYIQESYFTRFPYGYNLYFSYHTGLLYQSNFNFVKRIGDKKTYEGLKKKDLWFSDLINNKSKILLIDDTTKRVTYFDRSLKLVTEDFINEISEITDCGRGVTEAAQFDFCVNMEQDKIYGVRTFDKEWLYFATWQMPNMYCKKVE